MIADTGHGAAALWDVFGAAALVIIALACLLSGVAAATKARQLRFECEGAALSVLLPSNPTVSGADIAPHHRRPLGYQIWSTQTALEAPIQGARLPQWTWTPGTSRPLTTRPSAFSLRRLSIYCGAATVVVLVVAGVAILADPHPLTIFRWSDGAVTLFLVVGALAFRACFAAQAAEEYATGYATLSPISRVGARGST